MARRKSGKASRQATFTSESGLDVESVTACTTVTNYAEHAKGCNENGGHLPAADWSWLIRFRIQ